MCEEVIQGRGGGRRDQGQEDIRVTLQLRLQVRLTQTYHSCILGYSVYYIELKSGNSFNMCNHNNRVQLLCLCLATSLLTRRMHKDHFVLPNCPFFCLPKIRITPPKNIDFYSVLVNNKEVFVAYIPCTQQTRKSPKRLPPPSCRTGRPGSPPSQPRGVWSSLGTRLASMPVAIIHHTMGRTFQYFAG